MSIKLFVSKEKYFKLERKLHDVYVNLKYAYQTNDFDSINRLLKKKKRLEKILSCCKRR